MSYANVLASAGVVGAQYRTARDAGVTLSNLHFAPADVVAAAHGVNNAASLSDAAGSGIAAAKASLAFLEAVVTKVPALGTALSLASLGINLQKLHDEWAAGEVSAQTRGQRCDCGRAGQRPTHGRRGQRHARRRRRQRCPVRQQRQRCLDWW